MRQVLQRRSGLVVVRDVPQPRCPPGSVLVRTAFSAISSGTERARVVESQKSLLARARERPDVAREVIQRARREGVRATRAVVERKLAEETAVGYSSAGEIIRVGSAVRGLDIGDFVACAGAGHANHAEIASVPANLCAKVPSSVPLEAASLTTIAAIALHAVRLADVRVGERVAVIGCGLVGQMACRLLRAAGAEVFALDVDAGRVEQAVAGGADGGCVADDQAAGRVIDLSAGVGVDAVLVTAATASNDPLLLAAEIARDRAAIILVGDVPIELPRRPMYDKELSFRVSRSYGPGRYDADYEERGSDYPIGYVRWTIQRNMECVLDLQARNLLTLEDLVEGVVPVDDAPEAYARLLDDSERRPRGALLLSYAGKEVEPPRRPLASTPAVRQAKPQPSEGAPPRIGLVGPGGFATNVLIPALERAGARLEIVGGGSGPSAAAAARAHFARVAEDEDEVIKDPDVDALVISTRHESHAELVVRSLDAGKHVFCEKPIALSEAELVTVLEAANRSDRVLAVGFNRRFAPLLVRVRTFVAGADPTFVASYRVSAGSIAPQHWVHDLQQGGGRIIGEICHFVDALVFLADAPVKSVAAAALSDDRSPLQTRDNVVVNLALSNGSVGTVVYASAGSPRVSKERLEVFSGARTALLDDYRSIELYDENGVERERTRTADKGHDAEVAAFIDSICRGEHPVPLDVVANVSLATFAIVDSLATGAAIRLEHGA